jgi:pimeloyl-ACP methyl ester carboxylesterase
MLLVEMLSKHFTVYIYDRRGRGESTNEQPYAIEREIDDLESLIENAGGQAYLYGVSSGGALSLHATGKLGAAKVPKLAIFEAPYGQGKETFDKQKQGVNERIKNGKPGDAAEFFLSQIGTPAEALEKMKSSPAWRTIEKIDFTLAYDYQVLGDGAIPRNVVKSINIPTLVMVGEKGMDFMHATAEQLATLMPNAEYKTLKGQMHQPKAEAVAPVLIEFFNK